MPDWLCRCYQQAAGECITSGAAGGQLEILGIKIPCFSRLPGCLRVVIHVAASHLLSCVYPSRTCSQPPSCVPACLFVPATGVWRVCPPSSNLRPAIGTSYRHLCSRCRFVWNGGHVCVDRENPSSQCIRTYLEAALDCQLYLCSIFF